MSGTNQTTGNREDAETTTDRYILALDDGIAAIEVVAGYARHAAKELPVVAQDLRTLRDDLERNRSARGNQDFLIDG